MPCDALFSFFRCRWALLIVCISWSLAGCHSDGHAPLSSPYASSPSLQRLVVVGFEPALSNGKGPELVRNPITATSFLSWPVSEEVANRLTARLFEMLAKKTKAYLIPPAQARGVVQSILMSNSKIGIHPFELLKEICTAFEADAALIGQVYRWQDRVGTDYGVEKAASVAFDLSLVRSTDGGILWRGNYDKTQKSLMEDLFDVGTYIQGGGRWMTAEGLADMGIERLVAEMPLPPAETQEKDEGRADYPGN